MTNHFKYLFFVILDWFKDRFGDDSLEPTVGGKNIIPQALLEGRVPRHRVWIEKKENPRLYPSLGGRDPTLKGPY